MQFPNNSFRLSSPLVVPIRKGYEILEAGDGAEAIDLLGKNNPDLIFTDWRMPKLGGEDVLRHIQNDPRLSAISMENQLLCSVSDSTRASAWLRRSTRVFSACKSDSIKGG